MIKYIRKASSKPKPKSRRALKRVFNKYIRERDRNKKYLCISCGLRPISDAGHYFSVSVCRNPGMEFCEENVHGQCSTCNRFQEGNKQGYREGLIKRYGEGILERLDIKRSVSKNPWTVFEYKTMTEYYKKKLKEL